MRLGLFRLSVLLLAISTHGYAAAIYIGSVQDLADNSTVSGEAYVLNPGNSYTVTAPVSIYAARVGGIIFDGNSLSANAATGGGLTATFITIQNGTVDATASSSAANTHGMYSGRTAIQQNGTVNGYGGAIGNSHGFYANRGYTLNGGIFNAHGGSVANSYGLYGYAYAIEVNDGTLNGYAGTGTQAYGARSNTVTQNGGEINAYGYDQSNTSTSTSTGVYAGTLNMTGGDFNAWSGTATDSRGTFFSRAVQTGGEINAIGNAQNFASGRNDAFYTYGFTLSGGNVTTQGGGQNSRGMYANTLTVAAGDGSLTATGGTDRYGYGLEAGSITMDAGASGTILGIGGAAGVNAFGIQTDKITQNGGTLSGEGGQGQNAHGVSGSSIAMTGSAVLTGMGGSGSNADGVSIGTINMNDSARMDATGGSQTNADGIQATTLTQNSGTIEARGADANAAGLRVAGTATLLGGTVNAQGGSADGAHGVSAVRLTQSGGTTTATGGTAAGAHGIQSNNNYTINAGGTTIADSGSVDGAYGISAATLDVSGLLRLERSTKTSASVFVRNANGTVLQNGSVLVPVVDLQGDKDHDSGLLQTVAGGTVTIQPGARVEPYFIDHRNMSKGVVHEDYVFIDTGAMAGGPQGSIDGTFANPSGGLSLKYTTRKNAEGQYLITVERVLDIPEVIDMVPCINARRLMSVFEDLYDPNDPLISRVIMDIDHSRDRADLARIAAHIGKTLTPTAYAKLTGTQLRTIELMQDSVFRHVRSVGQWQEGRGWQGWVDGLYQQSSRFAPTCVEFDSPKEKLHGVSAGATRNFGRLALAGGFGFVHGSYQSGYSDTEVENYGLQLGAMLRDIVPAGGWFAPRASLVAGYSYGDIDQKLLNYPRTGWKHSSPTAHMARASVEMANDFSIGNVVLTPAIGLDCAVVHQGGYREHDPAGFGLRVFCNTYNSLRPRIGMDAAIAIDERWTLGARAHYRYETLDARSSFSYSRLTVPGIVLPLEGEDRRRHSGSLGAVIRYRLAERAHLSGEYAMQIEDNYRANQFSLGLEITF